MVFPDPGTDLVQYPLPCPVLAGGIAGRILSAGRLDGAHGHYPPRFPRPNPARSAGKPLRAGILVPDFHQHEPLRHHCHGFGRDDVFPVGRTDFRAGLFLSDLSLYGGLAGIRECYPGSGDLPDPPPALDHRTFRVYPGCRILGGGLPVRVPDADTAGRFPVGDGLGERRSPSDGICPAIPTGFRGHRGSDG